MSDNNVGLRRLLAVATDLVASLEACQRNDYGLDDFAGHDPVDGLRDSSGLDGAQQATPLDSGLDIPSL